MGWKKDTEEGECILGGMEKKKKKQETPGDGGALDWYQKW